MFDVMSQWEHQEAVVNAFVIERLHLRGKAVVEPIRNTFFFERSCLSSLINNHCRLLQEEQFGDGLLGRRAALSGTCAEVADTMRVQGMHLIVGDVVFHDGTAAWLLACAREDDNLLAIVEVMSHIRTVTAHSDAWRKTGSIVVCIAQRLQAAVAWYPDDFDWVVLRIA